MEKLQKIEKAKEKRMTERGAAWQAFVQGKWGGYKYDYSKVIYVDRKIPVIIGCSEHGPFEMAPFLHERKQCPKCIDVEKGVGDGMSDKDKEEIIKKRFSAEVENLVVNGSKVTLTCRKHGTFTFTASTYHNWKGCPACAQDRFKPDEPTAVYIIKMEDSIYKLGMTGSLDKRIKSLWATYGTGIQPVGCFFLPERGWAFLLEQHLLNSFEFAEGYKKQGWTEMRVLPPRISTAYHLYETKIQKWLEDRPQLRM